MWFFHNNTQICVTTVCILEECSKTVSGKFSKKLWIRNSNKYTRYRWNSLKSKTSYLLLHHYSSDCSLDHVGPVETVHAVDSEDALLLTDDSSLIHPVSSSRWILGLYIFICYYGGLQKNKLLMFTAAALIQNSNYICFNWHLPSPLHVRDDIRDGICQYLNVLKLHTSAETQNTRTKRM